MARSIDTHVPTLIPVIGGIATVGTKKYKVETAEEKDFLDLEDVTDKKAEYKSLGLTAKEIYNLDGITGIRQKLRTLFTNPYDSNNSNVIRNASEPITMRFDHKIPACWKPLFTEDELDNNVIDTSRLKLLYPGITEYGFGHAYTHWITGSRSWYNKAIDAVNANINLPMFKLLRLQVRGYAMNSMLESKWTTFKGGTKNISSLDQENGYKIIEAGESGPSNITYAGPAICMYFEFLNLQVGPVWAATPEMIELGLKDNLPDRLKDFNAFAPLIYLNSSKCERAGTQTHGWKDGHIQSFWTRPLPLTGWILGPMIAMALQQGHSLPGIKNYTPKDKIDQLYKMRERALTPTAA